MRGLADMLQVLVRTAGEIVTKDGLTDRSWPARSCSKNTRQVQTVAVRKALVTYRSLLKTRSGSGFRLLGDWAVRRHDAAALPVGLQRTRIDGESPVTNFPATVTHLVGRSRAVARLRDLLSAWRVVTLTGPAGIGKTSLALKAAGGVLGNFADGGWLVELASLSDPILVPSTVAAVLGLKLGAGENSDEAVARAIGDNNVLLLLDNCEHVIDAAASLVETLMRRCPFVTILATSREVLRVDGEYVYRVTPLEVPALDEDEPDQILSRSAVELFVTRANALNENFSPSTQSLTEIAAICRQLDGIPLAIELAAARAAVLGVRQVTAGLRDRFELLQGGRRFARSRHRTLRAALDWSYELLPESEKRLLRCLAIFSGGFTLAAAAFVANGFGRDISTVMDGIANLVTKSLVALDRARTESRWYLLETTRVYALEKLADSGSAALTARRHAEYCLALYAPFATAGQLQAALDDLGQYRREIDNLRAALYWAFSSDGDAGLGVALAAAGADFWVAASLMAEACKWSGTALARIGDAQGTRSEMILQSGLGMSLIFTEGTVDEARQALTRGLSLARTLTDFDYQQRTTHTLWLFALRVAAIDDALAIAREYDDVSRDRDPQSRAVADALVGAPRIYRGEHIEASKRLQRAIEQYSIECRNRDAIRFGNDLLASASSHLSVSLLSRGLVDTASRVAVRAVEEARARDRPTVLAFTLAFAASFVFLSLGEWDTAERYSEELIGLGLKHTLRPFHAAGICIRGSVAARRTDPNTGVDLLRSGLVELQAAGYMLLYPYFRVELAAALGAAGRVDDGLAEIDAALRAAVETGHRWFVPETLRVKGELFALHASGDPAVIADLFRRSMRLAREQQALYWELSAAMSLAELLRGQHSEAEARAALAQVYDGFTEGFAAAKVKRAKMLLDQLSQR
jgi:non-specific serine/threonine protein kinase